MSGDLISREAVLEVIRTTGVASAQEKLRIMAAVRAVPIVEAEPVIHAHWKKEIENGVYWYVCSECGNEVPKTRYKTDLYSAYCPYCGAHMDEEVADAEV